MNTKNLIFTVGGAVVGGFFGFLVWKVGVFLIFPLFVLLTAAVGGYFGNQYAKQSNLNNSDWEQ